VGENFGNPHCGKSSSVSADFTGEIEFGGEGVALESYNVVTKPARVVYIWRNERFPVFLITVFPKNEKENLSMAERNTLKKRADSIFETYGR
jgi:hypothetical protein